MSAKLRGAETFLKVLIDAKAPANGAGSMSKVKNWRITPRMDLVEDDYCGEEATDLDVQYHGVDLTFEVDVQDEQTIDLLMDIVNRELTGLTHPDLVVTLAHAMRQPGAQNRTIILTDGVIKVDEIGAQGRKERVPTSFSCKFKFIQVLNG